MKNRGKDRRQSKRRKKNAPVEQNKRESTDARVPIILEINLFILTIYL